MHLVNPTYWLYLAIRTNGLASLLCVAYRASDWHLLYGLQK